MTFGERHEDFDDRPVRCCCCGLYTDPELIARTRRGPVCDPCVKSGEADIVARPLASGVHVSAMRKVVLGALGFSPVHRNDGRGLEPRPSHPHEEGTLSERNAG
jgi:hypothetical protein